MKMMKFILLIASLAFLFGSCSKEENGIEISGNSISDTKIENRANDPCYSCISEDALGIAEGAGLGWWAGGPIGASIFGAAVGAYRSVREHNRVRGAGSVTGGGGSWDYPENFLNVLNASYDTLLDDNSYNFIGMKHNELLDSLILINNTLTDDEDYYDFMIDNISNDANFSGYTPTQQDKDSTLYVFTNGYNINSTHESLLDSLEIKLSDSTEYVNYIYNQNLVFETDTIALMMLSTAYHSFHFWNKLEEYE
jgi:hypothetical protein